MNGNIIITIMDKEKTYSHDIEVPVDKIGIDLMSDVFEFLNPMYPEKYYDAKYHCLYLFKQGRKLDNGETLGEAGVLNGDYVTIVSRI